MAQYLDYKLGEEVGEQGDIPVDALDQLTGRMGVVEAQVEGQDVCQQLVPQRVGRGPGHGLADCCRGNAQPLSHQRYGDEQTSRAEQRRFRTVRLRSVDEVAGHLWIDELQADAGQQQEGQQGDASTLGREVGREQTPILGQCDAHELLRERRHETRLAAVPRCAYRSLGTAEQPRALIGERWWSRSR